MRSNITVLASCILSGLLLQLAYPPFNIGLFALIAFVPALWKIEARSNLQNLVGGMLLGVVALALLPLSLTGWGVTVLLLSVILPASIFGFTLLLTAILIRSVTPSATPSTTSSINIATIGCFPVVWLLVVLIGQTYNTPIALAPLLLDFSTIITLSQLFGTESVEFLIALCSSSVTYLLRSFNDIRLRRSYLSAAIAITTLIFTALSPTTPNSQSNNTIPIYAIQPANSPEQIQASKWSLDVRSKQVKRVDQLTKTALNTTPGIVIWPEGGNELLNLRIPERMERFNQLLHNREHILFAGGKDLTPAGEQFNIISYHSRAGLQDIATKNRPVPLVERQLSAGKSKVFSTPFGKIGVAICFDGLFVDIFHRLISEDAEAIVIVTDDSSFGQGYLSELHMNHIRYYAASVGRSVVIANNYGLSLVSGRDGALLHIDQNGRTPKVNQWSLPVNSERVFSLRYGTTLFRTLFIVFLGFLILNAFRSNRVTHNNARVEKRGRIRNRQIAANVLIQGLCTLILPALLLTPLAWSLGLTSQSLHRATPLSDTVQPLKKNFVTAAAVDGIAPLFRQSSENSCGASAMAYLLTTYGATLFEWDITQSQPPNSASGYSFSELKEVAERFGFSANGYRAHWNDLPQIGETPVIVHLNRAHYYVALGRQGEQLFLFDPAEGATLHQQRDAFEQSWSGHLLKISTRPITDITIAKSTFFL